MAEDQVQKTKYVPKVINPQKFCSQWSVHSWQLDAMQKPTRREANGAFFFSFEIYFAGTI